MIIKLYIYIFTRNYFFSLIKDQSTADRLLESLSGLVSLDLRGNDLRGRSVSILAAVVRKCSALHSLHLAGFKIFVKLFDLEP